MTLNYHHIPVLLNEVITYLQIKENGTYLDATFGCGGYSSKIIGQGNCHLYAIDQDLNAQKIAQEKFNKKIEFYLENFKNIDKIFAKNILFDGVVFDIGVSSVQLDDKDRGFSFNQDGPLDMRMSPNLRSATELIQEVSEQELAQIIYSFGDEKHARKIAYEIVKTRQNAPITRTSELANIVRKIVKYSGKIDPATKTFQAIRIWVNDELTSLTLGLKHAFDRLKIGGRLIVITFHSGEDKIVKNYFRHICGIQAGSSRYYPESKKMTSYAKFVVNNVVVPTKDEIIKNPRSRSAKLRVIEKIGSHE